MTSALDVRCPYCGAAPGCFCRTPSGATRPAHAARKNTVPTDRVEVDQPATELTATLVINLTDSRCGHCRKNTLPSATHHTDISGWTPKPGQGCGARFVATSSDYGLVSDERLREMRPDLPARPIA